LSTHQGDHASEKVREFDIGLGKVMEIGKSNRTVKVKLMKVETEK